jgi:hypothetical protein
MSRIIFMMIAMGVIVVVAATININAVNAGQPSEFIQVSVLAENRANYGMEEQVIAIPAVSIEIIEDAAQDFQAQSPVRVITYTSLPTKEPTPDREEQQDSESPDDIKHDNGQGNAVENGKDANQGNNGNGGSNPNNGNGNDNSENKNKNKDKGNGGGGGNNKEKDNGGGGGNGGNEFEKGAEKETKPGRRE